MREDQCFARYYRGQCSNALMGVHLRSTCCCSIGAAWGSPCSACPAPGSSERAALCQGTVKPRSRYSEFISTAQYFLSYLRWLYILFRQVTFFRKSTNVSSSRTSVRTDSARVSLIHLFMTFIFSQKLRSDNVGTRFRLMSRGYL